MAAIVGIDDTDSRTNGMCTTYAATRIAQRLQTAGLPVGQRRLVRLHPAIEHKTRGNAALALAVDGDPERAFEIARETIDELAAREDDRTHPGLVVAPHDEASIPSAVAAFAREATRERVDLSRATALVDAHGYEAAGWGIGRGRIGALAAIGAPAVLDDWTYEHIVYRPQARWGTDREVDLDSVFEAADAGYPTVWDTVDRIEGEAVCVPHTPGPVLFGIRGDDPDVCREVAAGIDHEPPVCSTAFVTNQGTDSHLQDAAFDSLQDGRAYRVDCVVTGQPETRPGGHVFVDVCAPGEESPPDDSSSADRDADHTRQCAAFEPTKRFRDRVRALRPGDELTVCGELDDGTIKLEKFAVRSLVRTEPTTPTCPDCDRTMESAGADQGYRCRDCKTATDGKVDQPIDRVLEPGWYEVPPCARRHVAKPLVRGGFDAPIHPER